MYSARQRRAVALQQLREAEMARSAAAATEAEVRQNTVVPLEQRVPSGNFLVALEKLGLTNAEAANASAAAQQAFNLRQIRAGNTITVGRSVDGQLREIDYKIDGDRVLAIVPHEGIFSAAIKAIPSTMEIDAVSGQIEDSLFNAVQQSGESPELTMRLAQIFGYDLDFYTDPRRGDTFSGWDESELC